MTRMNSFLNAFIEVGLQNYRVDCGFRPASDILANQSQQVQRRSIPMKVRVDARLFWIAQPAHHRSDKIGIVNSRRQHIAIREAGQKVNGKGDRTVVGFESRLCPAAIRL
jgi:hypothetical protein